MERKNVSKRYRLCADVVKDTNHSDLEHLESRSTSNAAIYCTRALLQARLLLPGSREMVRDDRDTCNRVSKASAYNDTAFQRRYVVTIVLFIAKTSFCRVSDIERALSIRLSRSRGAVSLSLSL